MVPSSCGDFSRGCPRVRERRWLEDSCAHRGVPRRPQIVDDLNGRGVDAIKAVMEAGGPGMLFRRMDPGVLEPSLPRPRLRLPVSVHTGDVQDVRDAIAARADSVEHGSMRQIIPGDVFDRMKAGGMVYDPTLDSSRGSAVGRGRARRIRLTGRWFSRSVRPS